MSKRQEIRKRREKQKRQRQMITIGAIIIGAGLIAAALIYPSIQQTNQQNDLFASRPMAQDNAMGDPNAPIKIVEFSDYKCSHCGTFAAETEPKLVENYIETGQVYFVYRSVGGMLSGDQPLSAAEAAYCAGEQNKYWEFHDLVFGNQALNFTNSMLTGWAEKVGADVDDFKACLKENNALERAQQDERDAREKGVNGTPAFFITYTVNGEERERVLPGNYPFQGFQQELDAALQEMGLQ